MIINCGDSFTFGIGLDDQDQTYANRIGNHYGQHINMSKPGASHMAIDLQVQLAVEMKPDLITINTTSPDRLDWISYGRHSKIKTPYRLEHIRNNHYFRNELSQDTFILSETVSGLVGKLTGKFQHYLHEEPLDRIQLMVDHYTMTNNTSIKCDYDAGQVIMSYLRAKNASIPCLVLVNNFVQPALDGLIGENDKTNIDFFILAGQYPDPKGTGHCNADLHASIADKLIHHIDNHQKLK